MQKLSEVLSSPEKWTKHHLLKDKNGHSTLHTENAASCCLLGACYIAFGEEYSVDDCEIPPSVDLAEQQLVRIAKELFPCHLHRPYTRIATFNDAPNTTFEMIQKIMEKASKEYGL